MMVGGFGLQGEECGEEEKVGAVLEEIAKGGRYRLDGGYNLAPLQFTMKLEYIKSSESPIHGCSVAQQVRLLSQLMVLEFMGTRSLPT